MSTILHFRPSRTRRRRGFTLVEILVSLTVLSVLLLVSAQVISQVQDTWTKSNAKVSQFREARTAFDIITRNLSQATLNTYVDYDKNYLESADKVKAGRDASNVDAPTDYLRKSDLQFVCGPASELIQNGGGEQYLPGDAVFFQAPLGVAQQPGLVGLDRLLCGRGYYVQFSNDAFFKPPFLPPGQLRYRYRLMEFSPPAEKNSIYDNAAWYGEAGNPMDENENAQNRSLNRPVADNIVSLVISPRTEGAVESINNKGKFDSKEVVGANAQAKQGTQHLLPPMLKIILIAIDERSAERLSKGDTEEGPPLTEELNTFNSSVATGNLSDAAIQEALEQLKKDFVKKRINYRVFSSTVQIRGSKWSL